jgi:hypothetical protein
MTQDDHQYKPVRFICTSDHGIMVVTDLETNTGYRLSMPDQVQKLCVLLSSQNQLLIQAESFIAGFEDDELQEGIYPLLENIRKLI